jgi:hypothetical protein
MIGLYIGRSSASNQQARHDAHAIFDGTALEMRANGARCRAHRHQRAQARREPPECARQHRAPDGGRQGAGGAECPSSRPRCGGRRRSGARHRDEHKTKISPGRTKAPFLQNKPTEDDAKLKQSAMRRCSSFAFAAVRSRHYGRAKLRVRSGGVLAEQSHRCRPGDQPA